MPSYLSNIIEWPTSGQQYGHNWRWGCVALRAVLSWWPELLTSQATLGRN